MQCLGEARMLTWRPPWFDTMMPSAPASTARLASSGASTPCMGSTCARRVTAVRLTARGAGGAATLQAAALAALAAQLRRARAGALPPSSQLARALTSSGRRVRPLSQAMSAQVRPGSSSPAKCLPSG